MSSRWMMAAVTLVLAAVSAVGCVSKDEFDKVHAAWQRAEEARNKAFAELQSLRADRDRLQQELAARDGTIAGKDKLIANLESANADLTKRLNDLKAMYDKLAGREVKPGENVLPGAVDKAIRDLVTKYPELFVYYPELGMVKLKSVPTFDPGSTDVKPAAASAVKKLAEVLNIPEAKGLYVYVAGHTDDIPLTKQETLALHGSNWGLSVHRALAVVKTLFESGIDQARMSGMGFSMYHPVAPNAAGRKGNVENRRVELWITTPKFLTPSKVSAPAEGGSAAPAVAPTESGE